MHSKRIYDMSRVLEIFVAMKNVKFATVCYINALLKASVLFWLSTYRIYYHQYTSMFHFISYNFFGNNLTDLADPLQSRSNSHNYTRKLLNGDSPKWGIIWLCFFLKYEQLNALTILRRFQEFCFVTFGISGKKTYLIFRIVVAYKKQTTLIIVGNFIAQWNNRASANKYNFIVP